MAETVDTELLIGFIKEARGYLPTIAQGIALLPTEKIDSEIIDDTRRYIHIIKGAAAMVGLPGLSHIAYYLEEALEEFATGEQEQPTQVLAPLYGYLEAYLADDVLCGLQPEAPILTAATQIHRRWRGLPMEEDETAVAQLLADVQQTSQLVATEPADEMPNFLLEDEEIAAELLEAFTQEAEDHLRIISSLLTQLDKQPDQPEALREVRRSVHTLKGAAATVGLQSVADLTHRLEDLLDLAHESQMSLTPALVQLLFSSSDLLDDLVHGLVDAPAVQGLMQQYATWVNGRYASETDPPAIELPQLPETNRPLEFNTPVVKPTAPPTPTVQSDEVLRVPLERLNDLVRLASELIITRTTFEQRLGDLTRLATELDPSIERLRQLATRLETQYEVAALTSNSLKPPHTLNSNGRNGFMHEFDELEFDRYTEFHLLSRELAETTNDIKLVGNELNHLIVDFDGVLNNQNRVSSELQGKLMRTRMLPFATLTTRLQRAVRVVANKQAKLVDLVIEGEHIELDKKVLDDIADPLLHVLRNAVDHGIELPALRQVLGKPERGQIHLRAFYEGNQVVIQVRDDGTGLHPDLLRARARSTGYITEAEAATMPIKALQTLIFLPGFSTATQVDELSGRGVGLDVLKTNVYKLKGTVDVDSTPGKYLTFTIRLPMTLAVNRALLVRANQETFAIPLNAVTKIARIEREEVEYVGSEPMVRLGGSIYPFLRLGEVLKLKKPADESIIRTPVLVLNAGNREVALMVDEIQEGREIVVKPLGNHLRQVHGITGATLMGDGRVVLILNPADLVTHPAEMRYVPAGHSLTRTPAPNKPLTALVVDDSVSVRRVISNLVRSAGWEAKAAKDGVEALELIQSSVSLPDVILLDIEMPRMDGYELTAMLRSSDTFQHIPIVMITSRSGEKHRQKALDLGVSAYLAKPYTDEILLNTIRKLVRA